MTPLHRGGVIGVLGGGQLGRMLGHAAEQLGYRVHVLSPRPGPATQVTPDHTLADYEDEAALARFADAVDVVTSEFENVPASAAAFLAARVPVRPGPRALATCQDRIAEKTFLREAGIPTAPWGEAHGPADVARLAETLGRPCVLKTARFGYDGKGQAMVKAGTDPADAWATIAGHAPDAAGVVEGWVDFSWEASVVVARGLDGHTVCYPLVENRHRDHILHETLAPAPRATPDVAARAQALAERVAQALDIVGLIAVELFVGADGDLRVNELAARPHNSGHWSMNGARVSQFEQCIRAITGNPLGDARAIAPTRMVNLLGDEVLDRDRWLRDPDAHLHDYGKDEVRPGRKMGHVNIVQRG
ncbi:MAG: 5-(carboxyamino)imidazole ribonucleotide synthase [Alphaproteobacteria bacterium]|nr:5-(carboxyamino)imidazole ribonucleotide synthase [Alphaproteobacteria bacterium]